MEELKEEEKETVSEPVDLIEMVREKHSEGTVRSHEGMGDVFFMQLILCVLLVLIFAVIKLIESGITEWAVAEFKNLSTGETEEIFKQAVSRAVEFLR